MQFSIGDKVALKDETGFGTITKIDGGKVWVYLEDGIEIPVLSIQLVKMDTTAGEPPKTEAIAPKNTIQKPNKTESFNWDTKKKTIPKHKDPHFRVNTLDIGEPSTIQKKNGKQQLAHKPEIDLHTEALPLDCQNLTPIEILHYQLDCLKKFIDKARQQRQKQIVIIHGKGKGVLRAEVYHYLKNENIEFYDAAFSQYGSGATEVRLRHN